MTSYTLAVLLLVAAMSAQNAPNTNKAGDNTGIESLPKKEAIVAAPPKAQHRHRVLDIPAISREANGSVVSIMMLAANGEDVIAQGSGFVVSEDGRAVTNYHVIETGQYAVAKLPNGDYFWADGVLLSDKDRDVAIIKLSRNVYRAPDGEWKHSTMTAYGFQFRPLPLGDSDRLQVGEEVVAIGNPLSLESTVSSGIVSAIRTTEAQGGKFVQITAPISPGSSGGPLFNMAGEVVGITTAHMKDGENLGFAIPINDVKPLLGANLSSFPHLFPGYGKSDTPQAFSGPSLKETWQWIKTTAADGVKFHNESANESVDSVTYITPVGRPSPPCYTFMHVDYREGNFRMDYGDGFFLSEVDPDSIYQEGSQIKFAITDEQKNIERWMDNNPENQPDQHLNHDAFYVGDDGYRRRLMKAFKHAVILCGGKPSKDF